MLFTLSAIVFVFTVTHQTSNQAIRAPIAANNQGKPYAEFKWTPETWFKAVLDLPLVPIFIADVIACGVTSWAWLRLKKGKSARGGSTGSIEK
jgi:hypothetical protein